MAAISIPIDGDDLRDLPPPATQRPPSSSSSLEDLYPLPVASQELPKNADGSLKYHSIVLLEPTASSYATRETCWRVASVGIYILFGSAALTGFILTTLYAPGIVLYVSIAIALSGIGVKKLHNWCRKKEKIQEEKKDEDTFVEKKLKQWKDLTFEQALEKEVETSQNKAKDLEKEVETLNKENRDFQDKGMALKNEKDALQLLQTASTTLLQNHELSDHPAELNRLKTPFARLLYQIDQTQTIEENYKLLEVDKNIEDLTSKLEDVNSKREQAREKAQIDFSSFRKQYKAIDNERQGYENLQQNKDHAIACANCTKAQYLYLLRHPLNHIDPKITSLTCEIFPYTPGRHIFHAPATPPDRLKPLPYLQQLFTMLPDNKEYSRQDLSEKSANDFSILIEKAVAFHLQENAKRATSTLNVPPPSRLSDTELA